MLLMEDLNPYFLHPVMFCFCGREEKQRWLKGKKKTEDAE